MMPRYISAFLICFIFGVGAASLFLISSRWVLIALFSGMLLALIGMLASRVVSIFIFFGICGLIFGVWYVNLSFAENQYLDFLNNSINTEAVVAADPTVSGKSQQLSLLPDGFTQYIRASMYTPVTDVAKGDRVWIRGQIEMPENFNDFDYIGYLQRSNTYALLKKSRVIVLEKGGYSWRDPLVELREFVIKQTEVYPQSEGSLVAGMLIGQRQQPLPEETANAFKITGLTHIVAVSGFNMTIIATACAVLAWYIGRRAGNVMTIFIMFGFVVITGASAAVVRAAIMAAVMVFAQLLGRQYNSLYSLLLVASIMVLMNPRIVIWDVGFQLSVAATYGVLISFKIKNPESSNGFFSDLLRPTFGAIVMTAPIIAYHFKTFSVIAPLANLLVLPLVPWIMLAGALSLIPLFGSAFVMPAQFLASLVLQIAQKLSVLPYASINLELPVWVLLVYYFSVFLYVYFASKKVKNRRLQKPNETAKIQAIIT